MPENCQVHDFAVGNRDNTPYLLKDLSTDVLRCYPCKKAVIPLISLLLFKNMREFYLI